MKNTGGVQPNRLLGATSGPVRKSYKAAPPPPVFLNYLNKWVNIMNDREEMLDHIEGVVCCYCERPNIRHFCRDKTRPIFNKCTCCYDCECVFTKEGIQWGFRYKYEGRLSPRQ